jgi:predicted nucleic acid-binding protein
VTATLVDSNVLIDSLDPRSTWRAWADRALEDALDRGPLLVNQVIYAEISIAFSAVEQCDEALATRWVERVPLPWPASFLAGKAFVEYRRRGGAKRSPLPDFFIGAHAAVDGLGLLTRDPGRYRAYFPTVELIGPK